MADFFWFSDAQWVFVERSEAGVPMSRIIIEQKGQAGADKPPAAAPPFLAENKLFQGARKEVFALDEGDVVLTFPENISPDSYGDLEGYLNLFLKKAKRKAEQQRTEAFAAVEKAIPKKLGGDG